MIYVYKHRGRTKELEFPIGKAPQRVGKYERVYTVPVIRQLSALDRGDKPSISHGLPLYYGYGQRETCWRERMEALRMEDTPANRRAVLQSGKGPKPREIDRRSRLAAAKAGALDNFDKQGRPIARTKRGVHRHLETAKQLGDKLDWS